MALPPTGIICFAKDWSEDPTSNHHVLRELAKSRRVLWLNSLGTRTPKLSSARDLGKIRRKLTEFVRGPVNVENDLWVFSPLVLPLPHSAIARRINQQILRATIATMRLRLGLRRFQLWTFLPTVADYVGTLGEELSVYYCVDEWSMFTYLDGTATVEAERALLARVDCVFAINHALADAKRALHPETHCSPHGVDHAMFARALDERTEVPADLAALTGRGPVIGFYGTLQDWVDQDLIVALARRRPDWTFVLLGQQLCDVTRLTGLANVHMLGRRPHELLPAYCKGFSVGLIPYAMIERMAFVNPIKLREYLSAGLPVVSTAVPEVMRYPDWCSVGHTVDEIEAAIVRALADDTPARRRERSAAMTTETWTARVAQVAAIADDLAARRRPAGGAMTTPGSTSGALRAGIVGTGSLAALHVHGLRAGGIEVVGIAEPDPDRRAAAGASLGGRHVRRARRADRGRRQHRARLRSGVRPRGAGHRGARAGLPRRDRAADRHRARRRRAHRRGRPRARPDRHRQPRAAPRSADRARARPGSLRLARRRHRGRHRARRRVPDVRGRAAARALPRRRPSVPRGRRPRPVPARGAARPDRGDRRRVGVARRRPQPRLRRVARPGPLRARRRHAAAELERQAGRQPRRPPRQPRGAAGRSGRAPADPARLDAAARGRRAPARLAPAAARRPGQPLAAPAQGRSGAARGARADRRALRARLAAGEPPPVAIDDAARLVTWVEQVARAAEADRAATLARFAVSPTTAYALTGASGSLGGATLRRLLADGKRVRVLVRRVPAQPVSGVEYVFGNLGDPAAIDRLIQGAQTVIHVRAAMKGLARAPRQHRGRHAERGGVVSAPPGSRSSSTSARCR